MHFLVVRGIDLLAVAGAVAAAAVTILYLRLIEAEGGGAATWFVVLLGLVTVLCLLAAPARLRGRAGLLLLATMILGGLGVLAIFSVGFLLLLVALLPGVAFLLEVLQPPVGASAP